LLDDVCVSGNSLNAAQRLLEQEGATVTKLALTKENLNPERQSNREETAMSEPTDSNASKLVKGLAKAYLGHHEDIEIVQTDFNCHAGKADIIFREDGALVFACVRGSNDGTMPDENKIPLTRKDFEQIAIQYLYNNNVESCMVRFDDISMSINDDHRALLRRHRDCFANAERGGAEKTMVAHKEPVLNAR
jgi:Holliday junction resolvase-like predicted endonuclease